MEASPSTPLTEAENELLTRRREIAEAAIALADEGGINAVSMRNIAARLGVGTMTLYTWVENKDDLIAAMSDALAAQMLIPEPIPEDWREALTQIATTARDVIAAHPWMFSRRRPSAPPGANILLHVDQSLRAVAGLDLDWRTRASILQAVDNYAAGYALSNRRRREVNTPPSHPTTRSGRSEEANAIQLREIFAHDRAPALAEFFGSADHAMDRIRQGPPEIEHSFEDGLAWLLDGIEAMIARA